jgi:hypothetical protein
MRLLILVSTLSIAMAGTGCTVVGAGTGALAAATANGFIAKDSRHRISVGGTAAAGAIMGLIVDLLVLSKLQEVTHYPYPAGGDH